MQEMSQVTRFIKKLALAALPPVALLAGAYLLVDPFKVVRDYDDYYPDGRISPGVNKGVLVIDNFDRNFDSLHYDSFIFGSSLSKYYRLDEWMRYLPEGSSGIHLDSSSETLHSMRLKMEYVVRRGAHIKNALIVLAPDILSFYDIEAPSFIDHWKIDPDRSRLGYHWFMLKSFYNREFMRNYIASNVVGKPVMIGARVLLDTVTTRMDMLRNEEYHPEADHELDNNPLEYMQRYGHTKFLEEKPAELKRKIRPCSMEDAIHIAALLAREGTDYRVVIGPSLDGKYTDKEALRMLKAIFGPERVYDYSAELEPMRHTPGNFYDRTHYRSTVADEIMRRTYLDSLHTL